MLPSAGPQNLHRCFPPETEANGIHKVIDFVHDKVKSALEIIRREEMNKSLQTLFKEMNDHTTNSFEFGKLFLSYLLFFSKKIGSNLTSANGFDGKSIESGKLHYLLEKTTHVVFDTFGKDIELSQNRINCAIISDNAYHVPTNMIENNNSIPSSPQNAMAEKSRKSSSGYDIAIRGYEASLTSTIFIIKIEDPKGHQWIAKRSWSEFENFHACLVKELSDTPSSNPLVFPEKKMTLNAVTNSTEYYTALAARLDAYCLHLLDLMPDFNTRCQNILAKFLDTKYIIMSGSDRLHYAESIPNAFIPIRNIFQKQVMGQKDSAVPVDSNKKWFGVPQVAGSKSAGVDDNRDEYFINGILSEKELDEFRRIWGIEYCVKIFESYALLQRIATVLGWTLEINHFFISMFGNTVTFSRLPLRDIIATLRELLTKFLVLSNDIYNFACLLNAESKYKWHKNMQMAENELSRLKFHVEKTMAVITIIETEHLDYEAQMQRLKDVYARFQPFMSRVGPSLTNITSELGLPAPQYTFSVNQDHQLCLDNNYQDDKDAVNIFSRSISETSHHAGEYVNPLRSTHLNDDVRADGSLRIEDMNDLPKQNSQNEDSVAIRNEESSVVCVVS